MAPGEVLVMHSGADFDLGRTGWWIHMFGDVFMVLNEGVPEEEYQRTRAAFEAFCLSTPWGALYHAASPPPPHSAERMANRLASLLRFWEVLQGPRYAFRFGKKYTRATLRASAEEVRGPLQRLHLRGERAVVGLVQGVGAALALPVSLTRQAKEGVKELVPALHKGEHGGRRLLSERSVELMTTDHITPQQKAVSPFGPGFWDKRGWGYALSIVTHHEPGDPRGFGWDGGYGTSSYWDPETGLIGILLTQRVLDSPAAPAAFVDFWRSAYEAII